MTCRKSFLGRLLYGITALTFIQNRFMWNAIAHTWPNFHNARGKLALKLGHGYTECRIWARNGIPQTYVMWWHIHVFFPILAFAIAGVNSINKADYPIQPPRMDHVDKRLWRDKWFAILRLYREEREIWNHVVFILILWFGNAIAEITLKALGTQKAGICFFVIQNNYARYSINISQMQNKTVVNCLRNNIVQMLL